MDLPEVNITVTLRPFRNLRLHESDIKSFNSRIKVNGFNSKDYIEIKSKFEFNTANNLMYPFLAYGFKFHKEFKLESCLSLGIEIQLEVKNTALCLSKLKLDRK